MSWLLVKYVLTGAVRDRVILALLLLIMVGVSLSIFMGSAAVVEKASFATVFASGGLRLAGIAGLILFVIFFMRRSFEGKDVEFLLSRPVSRTQFLFSFAAGFSLLALILALAIGASVFALNPSIRMDGYLLWTASLVCEYVIMVNAALFFSMILSSAAVAAMVTFAFYLLARMMGQILGILDSGIYVFGYDVLKTVMEVVSLLTPRLDLMGQTSWLIYGTEAQIGLAFIIGQGVIFTVILLTASLVDLVRRQF